MKPTLKSAPWMIVLCALTWSASAAAAPPAGAQPADDPFAGALFPPELVMLHGDEIGLDAAQRDAIRQAIQEAQPVFVEHQLELQTELGRLRKVLAPARVDEDAVLEHLDRILAVERLLKRAQIGLLVRIKNLLSADQQQRLAELRRAESGR